MIERNPEIDAMAARVLEAAAALARGDVLTHEAIEAAAGIVRYTRHWGRLIVRLKRLMIDTRSIALWQMNEVGYRLCTPDEQVNMVAKKRQKKALRQLRRGKLEVGAVPQDELSMHQRIVQHNRLEQIEAQEKALTRSMRTQEKILTTQAMPRIPRM